MPGRTGTGNRMLQARGASRCINRRNSIAELPTDLLQRKYPGTRLCRTRP
jgi:hypothetical protein